MHELSIALSLIDLATEQAAELAPGGRVEALHLRLGPMSGVVEEALRFAFDLAAKGTEVDGSRLVIEHVPLIVYCPRCQDEREPSSPYSLICPDCQTPSPEVRQGRELELKALEVADA